MSITETSTATTRVESAPASTGPVVMQIVPALVTGGAKAVRWNTT